ncbi:hypothetical protein 2 [Hubei tombus-like virus 7]|uniref:hypothetical protein 2 n=1 Tax=Hubei tombus-like virus 7 TaxID=1923294 RepID=UPI00090B1716|nr:hypothetical protein 2 [Hubei tombus-like virus 7]APG76495.1 hypothetical protein 2 [Hubei tombus-like virus 7]
MTWIRKKLARAVRERVEYVQPLTIDQFVEQCPAQKRTLYAQAGSELRHRGWGARDARLKAFVKFEKIQFERSGKKSDPCPRLIQPRSPVYNVALGRYTRRVEEELYNALGSLWDVEEGEKVVMKGMTVEGVASQLRRKWDSFIDPVAVGLDASRFDQHVGVDALKFEHAVYLDIFADDDNTELRRLLKYQLHNRGYAVLDSHMVNYEIDGTRASGDMNTGLGNCILMSSLVRQYVLERGVVAKLANNGDDCLVFMERRDLKRFSDGLQSWFLRFGFNMTVEQPSVEFEECEFCQMRPVYADGWIMVRNPRAALSKDTMALGDTAKLYKQWIHSVGTAGLSLYGHLPLFRALYSRMRECGEPSRVGKSNQAWNSGFMQLSLRATSTAAELLARPITDECRVSFAKAFDISPSLQAVLEAELVRLDFDGVVDANFGTELALLA